MQFMIDAMGGRVKKAGNGNMDLRL
jgi:hypothetical protein